MKLTKSELRTLIAESIYDEMENTKPFRELSKRVYDIILDTLSKTTTLSYAERARIGNAAERVIKQEGEFFISKKGNVSLI